MHPLGRIGEVDDVVPVVTWLLSTEASWVTGQIIAVDGGLSALRAR
jgi:NAD(P)-dependent dehydrogenase (short-subunit alcohol dehydrogenase family)